MRPSTPAPLRLLPLVLWFLTAEPQLLLVAGQTTDTDYLLTEDILNYSNTVASLSEAAADPDLPNIIAGLAADLQFARLSYYWEMPFQATEDQFSQVILGRKDNVCYGVFHGMPMAGGDNNRLFVPNPQPIPNTDIRKRNCSGGNDECSCQAQWMWVDINFPKYWLELQGQLVTCMRECQSTVDEDCHLVLGGHGQGGMVAQLLSFRLNTLKLEPYVITMGASNVLFDNDCEGINEDRYYRFVNTDRPNSAGWNGNEANDNVQNGESDFGICFDDVPFLGVEDGLADVGHTIALGLEASGMAVALGGTGQLAQLDRKNQDSSALSTSRSSLCRAAHDREAYQRKLDLALMRNPAGVTPVGFGERQYCEADADCREGYTCKFNFNSNTGVPECAFRATSAPATPPPTTFPTVSPTSSEPTPNPTPAPTAIPTPAPTVTPTPMPTTESPTSSAPTLSPSTNSPTRPLETRAPTEMPNSEAPSTTSPTEQASDAPSTTPPVTSTTINPTVYPTASTTIVAVATSSPTGETSTVLDVGDPGGNDLNTSPPNGDDYISNDDGLTLNPSASLVPRPPSIAPTTSPVEVILPLHSDFFRVTLVLRDVTEKLGGFTVFLWEDETSDHIQTWIQEKYSDGSDNEDMFIEQLRVQANIVTQSLLYVTTTNNNGEDAEVEATALSSTESSEGDTPSPPVVAAITKQAKEKRNDDKDEDEGDEKENNSLQNRRTRVRRSRTRRTQVVTSTTVQALEIVFEIAVSYRSPEDSEIDVLNLIMQAFQSSEGRKQYATSLRDSKDPVFVNLSDFSLQVPNTASITSPNNNNGEDGSNIIVWSLIGAAVLAVAVSISLFVFYLRRNNSDKTKLDDSTSSHPNMKDQVIFEPASSGDDGLYPASSRMSSEIVVEKNEDDGISTLGEPMVFPGGMQHMMQSDEPTASVDYAQNYLGTHNYTPENSRNFGRERMPSDNTLNHTAASSSGRTLSKVGSGLSHLMINDSAIFSDNDSFEEQFAGQDECFEVSVPPGKLGIIIDLSPESGEPVVRAMRPDSALASKVRVGDRLLSLDGQGCTEMTAEQVSKLIAVKSDQEVRKIMFVRRQSDSM